jgi:cell division protein FtsW
LVFVPSISLYHAGARRWLSFGVFSFQPAELLKFSFIVYLAAWLESKAKHIGSFTFGLLPFAIMSSMVAALLIRQPDFGTLMVLLAAVGALFFVSGGHIKQLALLVIIGMIVLGVLVAIEPYRLSRISVFLNPSYDVRGAGYQIHQALIAVGSGGVFGKGFGLSAQKFGYLPEPIGDSIFAVLAEELGFVGSSALLILFLLFFVRGISIMQRVPDFFSQLLGTGFLFVITFQAITNIAAIIGLIPLTGIPLSFISYGGSSLAIMMAEVGIIINISRYRI